MQIQQLFEHSDNIIDLLTKIKLSRNTGVNTVPPAFAKAGATFYENKNIWEVEFNINFQENNILHIANTNKVWKVHFVSKFEKKEPKTKEQIDFICKFLTIPNLSEIKRMQLFIEDFCCDDETHEIIKNEAIYQAQKQNWPFL